jgi:hypothetical protein
MTALRRNVEMHDAPPTVADDEEAIDRDRRDLIASV